MIADALLARLAAVRGTGPGRWIARCPAHEDRSPSLSIRELDDGRVLVHDFGGCGVEAILDAVDLTFDDLFPPRPPRVEGYRPERRPWLAADAFNTVRHEVTVVSLIGCDLHKNKAVCETDYERLLIAVGRIEDIAEAAYGSR